MAGYGFAFDPHYKLIRVRVELENPATARESRSDNRPGNTCDKIPAND